MDINKIVCFDNYESQLKELLNNLTSSTLKNFLSLLPNEKNEEECYYWGLSYINSFYKKIIEVESIKQTCIDSVKIEECMHIEQIVYWLYDYFNYQKVNLSFAEFIAFSNILGLMFTEYNPIIIRKKEGQFNSGDKKIDNIVNSISYSVIHSKKNYAFEVDATRLLILKNEISKKISEKNLNNFNQLNIKYNEISNLILTASEKENLKRYIKMNQ